MRGPRDAGPCETRSRGCAGPVASGPTIDVARDPCAFAGLEERAEGLELGRRSAALDDEQRKATGIGGGHHENTRSAGMGIEFRRQTKGAERRILAAEPAIACGKRHALHHRQSRLAAKRPGRGCWTRAGGRRTAGRERHDGGDADQREPMAGTTRVQAASSREPRPSALSKIPRPSEPPCSGSMRFSGCGMRPSTLPRSFMMPAMSLIAPFGLVPSA